MRYLECSTHSTYTYCTESTLWDLKFNRNNLFLYWIHTKTWDYWLFNVYATWRLNQYWIYIQKHENIDSMVYATWGLHSSVTLYKSMRSLIQYGAKWLTTSMIQLYWFKTISIQVMPAMHTCQNKKALYHLQLEFWYFSCDWYINAFAHPAFNVECILQPPLPMIQCMIKVFSTPPWCRDVQRPS